MQQRWFHNVISIIVLGLLSLATPVFASSAEDDYQQARKKYYQLINSSQTGQETEWLVCVEMFRKVSTSYPKSKRAADALFTEGLLFWNMHQRFGRVESLYRAVEAYEKLVKSYPNNSLADDALYNVAIIFKDDLGDVNKAADNLDQLIRRYPRSEMAKQGRSLRSKVQRTASAPQPKPEQAPVSKPPKVIAAPMPKSAGGPVTIDNIRYWSNPEYTRVSIYVTDQPNYEHHFLKRDPKRKTPYRLYLDIRNTKLAGDVKRTIDIENGILERVRSGQNKSDVARVVLDMNSVHDYQISYRPDPGRIVIDVQGKLAQQQKKIDTPRVVEKTDSKVEISGEPVQKAETPQVKEAVVKEPQIVYQLPAVKSGDDSKPRASDLTVDLTKVPRRTIVIDPGHGGDDPGAKGPTGAREKDVVLAIGLKLRQILAKDKRYNVVMTRNRDIFIPLQQRSNIANNERGDLFVSIHADASPKRRTSGLSTYIFDNARDEYSKRLEARENASIMRGEKNKPDFLTMMFKSMAKNYFTNQSVELAGIVQNSLIRTLKRKYQHVRDLGVRQARFYVLWNTEMPSILVETSFISNRREERRLKSSFYQHEVANAIAKGIVAYMDKRYASKAN